MGRLYLLLALAAISFPVSAQPDTRQALFEDHCALCHRENGPGTFMLARRGDGRAAILEERQALTPEYIVAVVRNGIGSMPRFSRGEITDLELEGISSWLVDADNQ